MEQFKYITSHDLQEPLIILKNFSELLKEESNNETYQVAKVLKNGVGISLSDGTKNTYAYSVYVSGTEYGLAKYGKMECPLISPTDHNPPMPDLFMCSAKMYMWLRNNITQLKYGKTAKP